MPLIPLRKSDNTPDEGGMYMAAILLSALYHEREGVLRLYAQMTGTELKEYDANPFSETCQYALFLGQSECLVVLDGTTNEMQWAGHAGSVLVPGVDELVPLEDIDIYIATFPGGLAVCNSYWQNTLRQIRDTLWRWFRGNPNYTVRIIGHSYGAACAHMFARQMANDSETRPTIELLTFGEPRAYDGRAAKNEPDWHARIVASAVDDNNDDRFVVDPVTLIPPGFWSIGRFGKAGKILKVVGKLAWAHHGDPWVLTRTQMALGETLSQLLDIVPGIEYSRLLLSVGAFEMHFMDRNYLKLVRNHLARSQRYFVTQPEPIVVQSRSATQELDLTAFDSAFSDFTRTPFLPREEVGPRIPPSVVNEIYGLTGADAITSENYLEYGVFSASATCLDPRTMMPIVLNAGPGSLHVETSGSSGRRIFWLYRGQDREMIQTALDLLEAMVKRDSRKALGEDLIFPPDNEDLFNAVLQLINWFKVLLSISRDRPRRSS